MKKLALIGLVATLSAPVVSVNASSNACFGQARTFNVHLLGGRTWGDIASDRAGSNAALNRDYRDSCRG
ncbi:hypothetical protein [Sphingosinicella sp.]|uniref:hypothetical protein n=1 Tax=Sphingosinicella sp. TaxID=1917971 RepID=UPI004037EC4B